MISSGQRPAAIGYQEAQGGPMRPGFPPGDDVADVLAVIKV